MKKSPKYSVGSKVSYKDENGCNCEGLICCIAEVGKECFHYTLECENGKKRLLCEGKINESENDSE